MTDCQAAPTTTQSQNDTQTPPLSVNHQLYSYYETLCKMFNTLPIAFNAQEKIYTYNIPINSIEYYIMNLIDEEAISILKSLKTFCENFSSKAADDLTDLDQIMFLRFYVLLQYLTLRLNEKLKKPTQPCTPNESHNKIIEQSIISNHIASNLLGKISNASCLLVAVFLQFLPQSLIWCNVEDFFHVLSPTPDHARSSIKPIVEALQKIKTKTSSTDQILKFSKTRKKKNVPVPSVLKGYPKIIFPIPRDSIKPICMLFSDEQCCSPLIFSLPKSILLIKKFIVALNKELGKGCNGRVKSADLYDADRETFIPIAIKITQLNNPEERDIKHFYREVQDTYKFSPFLKPAGKDNIYGIRFFSTKPCIKGYFCQTKANGTLTEHIKKLAEKLSEVPQILIIKKQLLEILCSIITQLIAMHEQKHAHLDLKPSNILCLTVPNGDGQTINKPIISDFGSVEPFRKAIIYTPKGTQGTIASHIDPIFYTTKHPVDANNDVYSVGKLIHAMYKLVNPDSPPESTAMRDLFGHQLTTLAQQAVFYKGDPKSSQCSVPADRPYLNDFEKATTEELDRTKITLGL